MTGKPVVKSIDLDLSKLLGFDQLEYVNTSKVGKSKLRKLKHSLGASKVGGGKIAKFKEGLGASKIGLAKISKSIRA